MVSILVWIGYCFGFTLVVALIAGKVFKLGKSYENMWYETLLYFTPMYVITLILAIVWRWL
jgi:hypothetical protein